MRKGNGSKNQEHYDWLVKFVKDCNNVICVDGIKVTLNKLFGLNQRIVSHTCVCMLEVPVTHYSDLDFQNNFNYTHM